MSKFRTHPLRRADGGRPARREWGVNAQSMYDINQRQDYQQDRIEHGSQRRPDHPQRGPSPRAGRAGASIVRSARPRPTAWSRRRSVPASTAWSDRESREIYRQSHDSQQAWDRGQSWGRDGRDGWGRARLRQSRRRSPRLGQQPWRLGPSRRRSPRLGPRPQQRQLEPGPRPQRLGHNASNGWSVATDRTATNTQHGNGSEPRRQQRLEPRRQRRLEPRRRPAAPQPGNGTTTGNGGTGTARPAARTGTTTPATRHAARHRYATTGGNWRLAARHAGWRPAPARPAARRRRPTPATRNWGGFRRSRRRAPRAAPAATASDAATQRQLRRSQRRRRPQLRRPSLSCSRFLVRVDLSDPAARL